MKGSFQLIFFIHFWRSSLSTSTKKLTLINVTNGGEKTQNSFHIYYIKILYLFWLFFRDKWLKSVNCLTKSVLHCYGTLWKLWKLLRHSLPSEYSCRILLLSLLFLACKRLQCSQPKNEFVDSKMLSGAALGPFFSLSTAKRKRFWTRLNQRQYPMEVNSMAIFQTPIYYKTTKWSREFVHHFP